MAASAQFLLAYETRGADGKMHTHPSNAHEQQWDATDPTTDLSARSALFPAVIQAAGVLHTDPMLVQRLKAELSQIPPLPQAEKAIATGTKQPVDCGVIRLRALPNTTKRTLASSRSGPTT